MTRTFIALEMDRTLQRHLDEIIRQVAQVLPSVRWVVPESMHLTLAFLGELADSQLAEAIRATEIATQQVTAFSYSLSRLGIFGSLRQPRVIWMGIEEASGTLQRLHRILNRELEQRGFKVDTRPFSAHLTLAHIKVPLSLDEQQHLQCMLTRKPQGMVSSTVYSVQYVNVMKSELLRTGARYTCLREHTLKEKLCN